MDVIIDLSGIVIETDRLNLRMFAEADLADFYAYASVPGVGEMAGWPHHESFEDSKRILDRFISKKEVFAVFHKADGKVIGSLGLHNDSWANKDDTYKALKTKEIGYVLSKDYWGQGLMPEAVKAVIQYGFDILGIEAFTCCHFASNNQSRRVIEKCGFKFVRKDEFYSNQLQKAFEDMKYILVRETPAPDIAVRKAVLSDAADIAYILCESWRSADKDIITPEELERNTNLEARTKMFDKMLSSGVGFNAVAEVNGVPCGVISYNKSRDADLAGFAEIIAIYALEAYWGSGVGKRLIDYALSELKEQGFEHVMLWVFKDNRRARKFYEKQGFVADGKTRESGFANADEVRYRLRLI